MAAALDRACAALDRFTWFLGMLLLALMSALVIGEVGMRYLFSSSTTWVEEATRYLMVWLTMLAASSAIRRAELVGVSFAVERVPAAVRTALLLAGNLLVLAFLALVVYHGVAMVERSHVLRAAALQIPMSWVYLAVPVGAVLMMVQTLGLVARLLSGQEVRLAPIEGAAS